jgi:hypothetical protein
MNITIDLKTGPKELFIKMALSAWDSYNDRLQKLVEKLTDQQLSKEIAPGKNTGTYLFGHLIAIHDNLLPLFGLGKNLYPQLGKIFVDTPDKSGLAFPSIAELKKYAQEVNNKLSSHFSKMSADDWFSRHQAVSETDFAKEPHRNKLNVIINRTNHLSYHLGQMILLSTK